MVRVYSRRCFIPVPYSKDIFIGLNPKILPNHKNKSKLGLMSAEIQQLYNSFWDLQNFDLIVCVT